MLDQLPSPVSQVFHIPELVEIILYHLTPRDLLLSQRVSRTFQHTVLESPRLQKALFLTPDWRRDSQPFACFAELHTLNSKPENNRLLIRAFPGNYPTVTFQHVDPKTSGDNSSISSGTDTDTDDDTASFEAPDSGNRWVWDVDIAFPAGGRRPSIPCPTAVWRPEASWRRMFLSQPPCTSLHLRRRWRRNDQAAVVCEGGITMGAFVDAAMVGGASVSDDAAAEMGEGDYWQKWYVASDRDWHFEGSLGGGERRRRR